MLKGVQVLASFSTASFSVLSAQQEWGWLLFCQLRKLIIISQNVTYLREDSPGQTFKEVTQEINQPRKANFLCLNSFGAL